MLQQTLPFHLLTQNNNQAGNETNNLAILKSLKDSVKSLGNDLQLSSNKCQAIENEKLVLESKVKSLESQMNQ